eukprot:6272907-Pyramimonas_sp.AAC.1
MTCGCALLPHPVGSLAPQLPHWSRPCSGAEVRRHRLSSCDGSFRSTGVEFQVPACARHAKRPELDGRRLTCDCACVRACVR